MTERSPSAVRSPEERIERIRGLVSEKGSVRIDELAQQFGVSEMTIRRDLDELETLGLAHRVRGGAIARGPEAWERRHQHNAKAKTVIAAKLVSMVPKAGTVAFDASTTLYRLATAVEVARDLTVVTNGWDTFHSMKTTPGVSAVLTGGVEEPRTGSLVGPMAVQAAGAFLYSTFFTSAAALDAVFGSSESALDECAVKRVFRQNSQRVVLAVDHSKLGTRAQARLFDLADIDLLVTDLDPADAALDPFRNDVEIA